METLGHDHLDVAATLQNIATVLKHSDLAQSWEKFETSLGIIVGIYGHNHRSVADTLNNMGGVLFAQERYDEALNTYQESLEIAMSIMGPGHPDVAATLSNIGAVLEKQGKTKEAEERFAQVSLFPSLAVMPMHAAPCAFLGASVLQKHPISYRQQHLSLC